MQLSTLHIVLPSTEQELARCQACKLGMSVAAGTTSAGKKRGRYVRRVVSCLLLKVDADLFRAGAVSLQAIHTRLYISLATSAYPTKQYYLTHTVVT